MSDLGTRAAIRDFYGAYARGDQARVALLLHEDIDWVIPSPVSVFPFAGHRRGRAAVLEVMAAMAQLYQMETFKVEQTIIDGDRAVVLVNGSFTQRATGRQLHVRLAHWLRFNDGRLIEFREFADTFDLAEQALGRPLAI